MTQTKQRWSRQNGSLLRRADVAAVGKKMNHLLVILLMIGAVAMSGCGGDDESNAEFDKGSLMPASKDTAYSGAVDSMAMADTTSDAVDRSTEMPSLEPAAAEQSVGSKSGNAAAASQKASEMASSNEPSSAPEGDFSVQIGSFRSAENARGLAQRVTDMGYRPEVEVASLGGQTYHRVIVKGLISREEAERCGEDIRSSEGITYLIRHHK